jgi:hypothetical protein
MIYEQYLDPIDFLTKFSICFYVARRFAVCTQKTHSHFVALSVTLVSHFYSLRFHFLFAFIAKTFRTNPTFPTAETYRTPGGRNRSGLDAARSDATKTKTTNVRFVSNGDGNRTSLSLSLSLSSLVVVFFGLS